MPATAQSTSFTLPRGSSVIFELGGIGTATVDPSRISNVYRIGTQEAFLGPYDRSLTIFVSVESGTINYRIDADGDLSDQSPPLDRALMLSSSGLAIAGDSLTTGQAAQVRAGLFFDGGEVNFLDFVGSNNGLTDHYPALSALIDSLQSQPNSVGAAPVIYFPRGQWLLSGSVANSDAKRFSIRGDGPQATIIRRPAGATGDLFTLNAKGTYVRDLFIEGGRYQGVSGDSVVLNAPYTLCQNLFINKSGGSGVVVGKAGSAIAHVLENLIFRENAGYGIHVIAGSDSTDGMWSNVEIGNSGKHGVLLGTGSQNISNIHVWGSGLESDTETDGISIQSGGNLLNGWQSEKNLGRGVRIQSNNNVLSGGRAWGNCLGAVYVLGASNNNIVGNNFHQNSVLNTSGTTSTAFAAVFLDGAATRNTISGNMFWDNTNELPAGDYVTAPTYPYPGRTAVRTHAILIAETGTADLNSYLSNVAQRELTRLNSTTPPFILIGNGNNVSGNDWGVIPVPVRSVSSGAVRAPAEYDYISVTSSASITSVLGHRAGRVIRIHFANATPGTVVDNGGTLNLKGDYAPTTNDILTLISDGTNWTEVART